MNMKEYEYLFYTVLFVIEYFSPLHCLNAAEDMR